MSDYTPTTEEVFQSWKAGVEEWEGVCDRAEFYSWLNAHDAEVRADEREHIESAQLPMLAGILSSAGGTVRVPVAQQMLLDGVVTRMDEVDGTAVFRYLPAAARGDGERG